MDDERLVEGARRGEAEAFGELVRRYQHRIVNYISAMVNDRADAEDVAQEVFVRCYRALGQFRGESSFKTWLYQIATNAAWTELGRRRSSLEDAAGDPAATPHAFGDASSGENLEASLIQRDAIDRALATLPAELREAVVLRDVEGLDYREIAEALDIPIGTVMSRIFRARQKLKELLREARDGQERRRVSSGGGDPRATTS